MNGEILRHRVSWELEFYNVGFAVYRNNFDVRDLVIY